MESSSHLRPVPDDTNTLLSMFCSSSRLVPQSLSIFRSLFLQIRFLVRQGSTQTEHTKLQVIYKYLFEIHKETIETLKPYVDSLEEIHFSKKKVNQKQSLSYLRMMEIATDGLLCTALSLYFRKQQGQCTTDEMIQFRELSKRVFSCLPSTLLHSDIKINDIYNYYINNEPSPRDTPLRRSESLFLSFNQQHQQHQLTEIMFHSFLSACIWLSLGPLDFLLKLRRTFGFVPYAAVGSAAAFLVMQQPLVAAGCAVGMCLVVFSLASGADEDLPADLNALLSGHVDLKDLFQNSHDPPTSDISGHHQRSGTSYGYNNINNYSPTQIPMSNRVAYSTNVGQFDHQQNYRAYSHRGKWDILRFATNNFHHANSLFGNLLSIVKSGVTHKLSEMFPILYLMQISHSSNMIGRFRSLPQWSEFLSTQLAERPFSFSSISGNNNPWSNMNTSILSSLTSIFKIWKQNPSAFNNPTQAMLTMATRFKDPLLGLLNRSSNSNTQQYESEESIFEELMPEITSLISGVLSTVVTRMPAVWIPSQNIHRLFGRLLNTFFYDIRSSSLRYRTALLVHIERIILEENSAAPSTTPPKNIATAFFETLTSRL